MRDAQGVFNQVNQDANSSCDKLSGVLSQVHAASLALTSAANQVSSTAQSLSISASEHPEKQRAGAGDLGGFAG